MARGRMVAKKISISKALSDLSDDTSRMLFTWTIPHLDREGRIHGDPCVLRSTVAPRLQHIDDSVMERCIAEWHKAGLVIWYKCHGDKYLSFPKFLDNQRGLHTEREQPSDIPDPACSDCRTFAGNSPATAGPLPEIVRQLPDCSVTTRRAMESKERESKVSQELAPTGGAPTGASDGLHHSVQKAFEAKHGHFSDYPKEGKAIQRLVKKATELFPDDPRAFIAQLMSTFWDLKETGDPFWQSQPFTPSTLSSGGIFDRVCERLRTTAPASADAAAAIKGVFK